MGKIISKVKHPFRNFNLESRAHKVIGATKPKPAPRHLKDELDLKRIKRDYPEMVEEGLKKNLQLDKHLKDVYVVSHDSPLEIKPKVNPTRPLPQDRTQPDPLLFGHKEPDIIPPGKTTLRNALQFISQHQNDSTTYSAERIAEEHKLSVDLVKNILIYYRVFQIYIPDQLTKTKATFAGPSKPKTYVIKDIRKFLPPPATLKDKDDT